MTQEAVASKGAVYDADYYLNGVKSGKSLYENYRWLPDLTLPIARVIAEHLGIRPRETVLDYGCARGYLVKAFRLHGIPAYGVDISEWAVENADPDVKDDLICGAHPSGHFDWFLAKDVLEHIEEADLEILVSEMLGHSTSGCFVVVPLSRKKGERYVCPDYEKDVTHKIRWDIHTWIDLFARHNRGRFTMEASLRIRGIKDNYRDWPDGNGFITMRRR